MTVQNTQSYIRRDAVTIVGSGSVPSIAPSGGGSFDPPPPTECACLRIATDQINTILLIKEFNGVCSTPGGGGGPGVFIWKGETSGAIGTHVAYVYTATSTPGIFQQYLVLSMWNGIDFIDGENLLVPSGPPCATPGSFMDSQIDVRDTPQGGSNQTIVDCDTFQACEEDSGGSRIIIHPVPGPTVIGPPDQPYAPPPTESGSFADPQPNKMGMNLAPIQYFGAHQPWKNVFLGSGASFSHGWVPSSGILADFTVDSNGWVTTLNSSSIETYMMRSIAGHYRAGRYVCLYDSDGTDQLAAGTIWVAGNAIPDLGSSSVGRFEFDLTAGSLGITLQLFAPLPSSPNHIRNIRIMHEDDEASYTTEPWNEDFIEFCTGFNTLRFMDWPYVNDSTWTNFSDRVPNTYRTYGQNGVPYEQMCSLCNEVQSNAWICVPHLATNAFVTSLATLLHANLDAGLKIYVEHSNEVWNSGFQQYSYALTQAAARGFSGDYTGAAQYHAQRSAEIWALFVAVCGVGRVVRVLGSQYDVGSAFWASVGLGTPATGGGNVRDTCDAVAIAPYWGAHLGSPTGDVNLNTSAYQAWNPADPTHSIIHLTRQDHGNDHINFTINNYLGLLGQPENAGIRLIAYEGGQHLVGIGSALSNSQMTALFTAANRHAEMYGTYIIGIGDWMEDVDDLFVAYHSSGPYGSDGSWGVREYQDTPIETAHKERAIRQFMTTFQLLSSTSYYNGIIAMRTDDDYSSVIAGYENSGPILIRSKYNRPSPEATLTGFNGSAHLIYMTRCRLATNGSWFRPGDILELLHNGIVIGEVNLANPHEQAVLTIGETISGVIDVPDLPFP